MKKISVIAELVFVWSFSVALLLAAADWIRPLSVSPFFNVGWLIGIAAVSLVVQALLPIECNPLGPPYAKGEERNGEARRPPWILLVGVFIFSAVVARSLGWLAAVALGGLSAVVLLGLTSEIGETSKRL